MFNRSYRVSTPLVHSIKNVGYSNAPTKTKTVSAFPSLISKTVSPNEQYQTSMLKQPTVHQIQSYTVPNYFIASSNKHNQPLPAKHPQKIFTDNKSLFHNKAFRHKTLLTAQPQLRQYASDVATPNSGTSPTTHQESHMRHYTPPGVQNLVENAPKTGYHGESIDHMLKEGNYDKRQFGYFIANSGRFIFAAGIRLLVLRFLYSWSAAADVLAVAKIEVDVSNVPEGKTITVTWRGKPVFIKHRAQHEIDQIKSIPVSSLRDPQSDEERTTNPNWSIVLAICTHLGCVPVTDAGEWDAFFCPCHGSHYDASGRIMKGPAPLNLEVPKHSLSEDEKTITLG